MSISQLPLKTTSHRNIDLQFDAFSNQNLCTYLLLSIISAPVRFRVIEFYKWENMLGVRFPGALFNWVLDLLTQLGEQLCAMAFVSGLAWPGLASARPGICSQLSPQIIFIHQIFVFICNAFPLEFLAAIYCSQVSIKMFAESRFKGQHCSSRQSSSTQPAPLHPTLTFTLVLRGFWLSAAPSPIALGVLYRSSSTLSASASSLANNNSNNNSRSNNNNVISFQVLVR